MDRACSTTSHLHEVPHSRDANRRERWPRRQRKCFAEAAGPACTVVGPWQSSVAAKLESRNYCRRCISRRAREGWHGPPEAVVAAQPGGQSFIVVTRQTFSLSTFSSTYESIESHTISNKANGALEYSREGKITSENEKCIKNVDASEYRTVILSDMESVSELGLDNDILNVNLRNITLPSG